MSYKAFNNVNYMNQDTTQDTEIYSLYHKKTNKFLKSSKIKYQDSNFEYNDYIQLSSSQQFSTSNNDNLSKNPEHYFMFISPRYKHINFNKFNSNFNLTPGYLYNLGHKKLLKNYRISNSFPMDIHTINIYKNHNKAHQIVELYPNCLSCNSSNPAYYKNNLTNSDLSELFTNENNQICRHVHNYKKESTIDIPINTINQYFIEYKEGLNSYYLKILDTALTDFNIITFTSGTGTAASVPKINTTFKNNFDIVYNKKLEISDITDTLDTKIYFNHKKMDIIYQI